MNGFIESLEYEFGADWVMMLCIFSIIALLILIILICSFSITRTVQAMTSYSQVNTRFPLTITYSKPRSVFMFNKMTSTKGYDMFYSFDSGMENLLNEDINKERILVAKISEEEKDEIPEDDGKSYVIVAKNEDRSFLTCKYLMGLFVSYIYFPEFTDFEEIYNKYFVTGKLKMPKDVFDHQIYTLTHKISPKNDHPYVLLATKDPGGSRINLTFVKIKDIYGIYASVVRTYY